MFIRRVSPSSPTRVIQYIFCSLRDEPIALFTFPSRGRISVDASVDRGFFLLGGSSKAAKFVCAIQTSHKCDFWCVSSLLSQPAARNETFIPAGRRFVDIEKVNEGNGSGSYVCAVTEWHSLEVHWCIEHNWGAQFVTGRCMSSEVLMEQARHESMLAMQNDMIEGVCKRAVATRGDVIERLWRPASGHGTNAGQSSYISFSSRRLPMLTDRCFAIQKATSANFTLEFFQPAAPRHSFPLTFPRSRVAEDFRGDTIEIFVIV
jgi:hypothetical protein